jgi:peptide/nickel transport system substrate-binding protein
MMGNLRAFAIAGGLIIALCSAGGALAQKAGGTLKISFFDNPASMSLHEEATGAALRPMMGVFNNLVMFRQDVAQNSPDSIIPDLATSWSWSEDGKELTFPLRQGVKWHDGKPFTAADVKCTWDLLLGVGGEKLRVNPRQTWYSNLDRVATSGEHEVTFYLKRPQPALLSLLASGWSPVYPCHVSPREMRTSSDRHWPLQTVEFKPNEVVKNGEKPEIGSPGRPYPHVRHQAHHAGWQLAQPELSWWQVRHLFALRNDGSVAGETSRARRRRRSAR